MKLNEKSPNKSHRVLLFGSPKSGKTMLAGQISAAFNLIWIDLENGVDTLLQLPISQQEKIEVISLPDTRDYPIAIETCLKLIGGGRNEVCEDHGKVLCAVCRKDSRPFSVVDFSSLGLDTVVVFDSLTQLTNSAIAQIARGKPEDYKFEYDDWAKLGMLMDKFLSKVQQAKFHICCISHETEVEMEDGKNKLVPTAGTRNFSRNTAKYFDEVVYCEVKNKRHVAASSTLYNGNILTGSRTGSSLEDQAHASLIPVFKGEIIPKSIVNVGTPAQTAVTKLSSLALRLKKQGA